MVVQGETLGKQQLTDKKTGKQLYVMLHDLQTDPQMFLLHDLHTDTQMFFLPDLQTI